MADREFSVILKATDLSSQPIREIIQSLNALKTAQAAFNAAAQEGKAVPKEFEANLKAMLAAAKAVSDQITRIELFVKVQNDHADKVERLAKAYQDLAAKQAEGPADDSKGAGNKFAKEISAIEKTIKSLEKAVGSSSDALEKLRASLSNIGVNVQPDTQLLGLQRELTKALNERAAAQDRVNAKIASLPPEDERTKRQVNDLGRLEASAQKTQNRVDGLEGAIERYSGVKLNEAITQRLEEARGALASITTVTQDANKETLTLVQGYNAATKAAKDRADAERALAAAEAKSDEEFAARNRAERASEQQRFGTPDKLGQLQGGEVDRATQAAQTAKGPRPDEQIAHYLSLFNQIDTAEKAEEARVKQVNKALSDLLGVYVKTEADAVKAYNGISKAAQDSADAETRAVADGAEKAYQTRQTIDERLAAARAKNDKDQAARLEQLRESQGKIADAQAELGAIKPLGVSSEPAQQFSSLSAQLSALLSPAEAARQTFEGVKNEVTSLALALSGSRKRVEDYREDLRNLASALSALQRQGSLVDTYRAQEAAVKRLGDELMRERSVLAAMNELYARTGVYEEDQVRRVLAQTNTVKQLEASYTTLNNAFAKSRAGLEAAGIDWKNLDVEMQRLLATMRLGEGVFAGLEKRAGVSGGPVLFGLRAYEVQNLTYQINDVITQLSSGTSISQTFSQQFGQIFQLFQRQLFDAFLRLKDIPGAVAGIGTAAVVASLGVLALVRAMDQAAERRNFASQLALSADGAQVSVGKLEEAAKAVELLGANYTDAAKGARELAAAGFNERQIEPLLKLAQNLSVASRVSLADAVKEVVTTFAGGYESFRRSDLIFGSLSARTNQLAKDLFEAGKADQARALIFAEVTRKAQEGADAQRSTWNRAWTEIKNDWHSLLEAFSSPVAQGALGIFKDWAVDILGNFHEQLTVVRAIVGLLPGVGQASRQSTSVPTAPGQPSGPAVQATTGGTQAGGTARGDRNNNPGNLKFRGQEGAVAEGVPASDGGTFAKFVDLESGVAAALRQYLRYQDRGLETIKQMVETATPPVRNGGQNPDAVVDRYITTVAREMGVAIDQKINLRDRNTAVQYIQAVARQEGNKPPSEAVAQAGVSRVLGARPGEAQQGIFGADGAPTEAGKKATADFIDNTRKGTIAMKDARLEGDAALERENELIEEEGKKLRAERDKLVQEYHATNADREKTEQAIQERLDAIRSQYAHARLEKERSVYDQLQGLEEQQGKQDQTNLDRRLDAVDRRFQTVRNSIEEKFRGIDAAQRVNGHTRDEVLADVERLHEDARQRETLETAQAITRDVVEQREKAIEAIRALQLGATETGNRITETLAQFGPRIREAIGRSNKILQDQIGAGRDSPAIQLELQHNQTVLTQANRPQTATAALGEAQKRAEDDFENLVKERDNRFKDIIERERSGAITIAQALQEAAQVTSGLGPRLQEQLTKSIADLTALRANSQLNDTQRSAIDLRISQMRAQFNRIQEDYNQIIDAGIKDDADKLEALIKERNLKLAEVNKRIADGLLRDPAEAARQLAAISDTYNAQIKAASSRVVQNIRTALTSPNITPGARANLQERLVGAEQAGDTQRTDLEGTRTSIEGFLKRANDARSIISDTARTQNELLSKSLTTGTGAEEAIKRAYEDANKAAQPQIEALNTLIDRYKELGASDAQVARVRDQIKLLNADLQYVDPLVQQITKGFEQSFVSRGEQFFDAFAKSVGTAIATGGKLKDIFHETGIAFANMAAGILQDIAKIIIKYELLKLINDALGSNYGNTKGLAGTTSANPISGVSTSLLTSALGAVTSNNNSLSNLFKGLGNLFGGAVGTFGGAVGSAAVPFTSTVGGLSADAIMSVGNMGGGIIQTGASAASSAGGWLSGIGSWISSLFHEGGIVGAPGSMSRPVDVSVFHEAQRYHDGGMVGLRHDEVPIIAERGEKIISLAEQRQQRDAANAAKSAQPTGIRNVLAVGDREIANAMNSSHGEKTILNVLQRNAPTVKKYIG